MTSTHTHPPTTDPIFVFTDHSYHSLVDLFKRYNAETTQQVTNIATRPQDEHEIVDCMIRINFIVADIMAVLTDAMILSVDLKYSHGPGGGKEYPYVGVYMMRNEKKLFLETTWNMAGEAAGEKQKWNAAHVQYLWEELPRAEVDECIRLSKDAEFREMEVVHWIAPARGRCVWWGRNPLLLADDNLPILAMMTTSAGSGFYELW